MLVYELIKGERVLKEFMVSNSVWAKDLGLLIMRVGLGLVFVRHGYGKIIGGYEEWIWLGNQMANIGITFFPLFWGLCAAGADFLGGLALIFGFGTRLASFFLAFIMFVAVMYHITKGDSFGYISHPLSLFFVFLGLMIAGAGSFSLDQMIGK